MSDKNACEACPSNYECSKLRFALEMLGRESRGCLSFLAKDAEKELRNRLAEYGFQFDDSGDLCWLHDKRSVVQDLTDQAISILGDVRDSNRDRPVSVPTAGLR